MRYAGRYVQAAGEKATYLCTNSVRYVSSHGLCRRTGICKHTFRYFQPFRPIPTSFSAILSLSEYDTYSCHILPHHPLYVQPSSTRANERTTLLRIYRPRTKHTCSLTHSPTRPYSLLRRLLLLIISPRTRSTNHLPPFRLRAPQ